MESRDSQEKADGSDNSIQDMIEEAKAINERGRRSTAGAKFMAELLEYITSESKRRATPLRQEDSQSPNRSTTLEAEDEDGV